MRALLDQIERENLGLLIFVLLHHLDAVDDGADRTDQVVANPRAQQCRKVESANGYGTGDGGGHDGLRAQMRRSVGVTARAIRQSCRRCESCATGVAPAM